MSSVDNLVAKKREVDGKLARAQMKVSAKEDEIKELRAEVAKVEAKIQAKEGELKVLKREEETLLAEQAKADIAISNAQDALAKATTEKK